jgi:hypothetical protein
MEERLQVLKMVEAGQISAEEAAKLLTALENPPEPPEGKSTPKRWLRVRVTDQRTGKRKVNVNVPLGLVEMASRMGVHFGAQKAPELRDINLNEIMTAIKSGAEGKIVDVQDEEKGELVEVYVE